MKQEQYFEDHFKKRNSPIIVSKRNATAKSPGCFVNLHEYIEFYYVIRGGVKVHYNGVSLWVREGDIAFINWCQPHRSLCFLDDTTYYIVQIDLNAFTCGNADLFQLKFVSRLISDMPYFQYFFHNDSILTGYFHSLIYEYENDFFTRELLMQAATCNILAYILNSKNGFGEPRENAGTTETADYAKRIMQYLHINYQGEIRIDHIAMFLGISPAYMCRVFKQYTGTTIIRYTNQLRCKKALSLMKEGYSMTQAADSAGYNDYTYFSRAFKKIYGMSPKELIKKPQAQE